MTTEEKHRIESALSELSKLGFTCAKDGWRELTERTQREDARKPEEKDRMWLLREPISLAEHLSGARPVLSCQIAVGRAYCLTHAQRRVLMEWFSMTAGEWVTVKEIATFPGEPKVVKHVTLCSEEHIDARRKRLINGPRSVVIEKWGEFCSTVLQREKEMLDGYTIDKLNGRVERLLKRAKEKGVPTAVRQSLGVAHQWHAGIVQKTVECEREQPPRCVTQAEVRECLREILRRMGEEGLIKLVKAPNPVGNAPKLSLDELLAKLERGEIPE